MKTEPTEADKLRNSIQYHLGVMDAGSGQFQEISCKIYELFELSYKEGQSSPKIKQLEWEKSPFFKGNYEAKFGLGEYFIDDCGGCITLVCPDQSLKKEFSTIDEAKAAAQADFEKRVMECLDL